MPINYWVFQCNPKDYDLHQHWTKHTLNENWRVSAHKDKITLGDKVIIWMSGSNGGCYGLGTITSEVYESDSISLVDFTIDHNFIEYPFLVSIFKQFDEFKMFKGGNQGSNFQSSVDEYENILILYNLLPIEKISKLAIRYLRNLNHPASVDLKLRNNKSDNYRKLLFTPTIPGVHFEICIRNGLYRVELHSEASVIKKREFDKLLEEIPLNEEKFFYDTWSHFRRVCTRQSINIEDVDSGKKLGDLIADMYNHYYEIIRNHYFPTISKTSSKMTKVKNIIMPQNTILYGPPGTGKTYNSIKKAVSLANPDFNVEQDYKKVKLEYNRLLNLGRIAFTTFHQSMSYEDFVEGIKPSSEDGIITYDVEAGIFKEICEKAKTINSQSIDIDWRNRRFFKMSLGGKHRPEIHDYCIENEIITLGWGGDRDLRDISDTKDWHEYNDNFIGALPDLFSESSFHVTASYIFLNKMNVGDVVLISKGNQVIDAIGIIMGDYSHESSNTIGYPHYRKVEWIAKDINTSPSRFVRKGISQMSIYEFYTKDIIFKAFEELSKPTERSRPYVLIIDEINRGNISSILGELITLIEPSKRLDMEEELTVTLPYSKSEFGVPSNLHILGTMNTADRSIALLDTALRRRFEFEEMMPDPKLLKNMKVEEYEDINLELILKKINERIEFLLDRDHMIGHSYFMGIVTYDDLCDVFQNKVIPLLQEYFYNDWEKVRLVLGDNDKWGKNKNEQLVQIKEKYDIEKEKGLFGEDLEDYEDEIIYQVNPLLLYQEKEKISPQAFIKIYTVKKDSSN
jgi:hypothetical protein